MEASQKRVRQRHHSAPAVPSWLLDLHRDTDQHLLALRAAAAQPNLLATDAGLVNLNDPIIRMRILETGLDRQPLAVQGAVLALDDHANVCGAAYYAAGAEVLNGRVGAPIQANQPDGASDQAHQMPQDRFARGGEGSGYAPVLVVAAGPAAASG
jgi:hypothetical protein